jgi:hypothetical protein
LVLAVFKEMELGFIGSNRLSCGRLLFGWIAGRTAQASSAWRWL